MRQSGTAIIIDHDDVKVPGFDIRTSIREAFTTSLNNRDASPPVVTVFRVAATASADHLFSLGKLVHVPLSRRYCAIKGLRVRAVVTMTKTRGRVLKV